MKHNGLGAPQVDTKLAERVAKNIESEKTTASIPWETNAKMPPKVEIETNLNNAKYMRK